MPEISIDFVLRLLACFAAGSFPTAVLAMRGTGIDIRKVGSGNPGFNNVLRVSKGRAVITLAGDMGKGLLAVWLVTRAGDTAVAGWLYGFAAVLGHCYSPFLKFNGGKGVATSGGVMLVLYPFWAAVALAFFAAVRLLGSKRKWAEAGTRASLSTWVLFTVLMLAAAGLRDAAMAALMTAFLAWRHRANFQRLLAPARPMTASPSAGSQTV